MERYHHLCHHHHLRLAVILCWSFLFLPAAAAVEKPSFAFSFDGFRNDPIFAAEFVLLGAAHLGNDSVNLITNATTSSGGVLHRTPIDFGRRPTFSTDFSFSNAAVAFLIAPENVANVWLSRRRSGFRVRVPPGVFSVEFGDRVGVSIGTGETETFNVSSTKFVRGERKLHAWIDFDGLDNVLEIRLTKFGRSRPDKPLVVCRIDLSGLIWQHSMFVAVQVSGLLYSWSFRLNHAAPYRMHSEPLNPRQQTALPPLSEKPKLASSTAEDDHRLSMVLMALAFGAACGAAVAFVLLLAWSVDCRPVAPAEYRREDPVMFEYEKIVVVGEKGVDGEKI